MDKVRLLLTVITIAINVLPIAGVLIMYRDNLLGLVVPPEINTIIDEGVTSEGSLEDAVENFTLTDSHYDAESRTVSLTFEVTNPLKFDVAVNSLSADVFCAEHHFLLGHGGITNPVDFDAGETAAVGVEGTWTEEAINHILTAHAGEKTIDIGLSELSVDVSGVSVDTDELVVIPNFPIEYLEDLK